MTRHDLNCARLDERLADYLEGDLAAGERVALEAHIASCVRCTSLVRDLESIRLDAGELGELAPSRDLWSGIAERIETPVVPLTVRAGGAGGAAPNVNRRGERIRLAAVAAALVAVTAGVTYTLTVARGGAPLPVVAGASQDSLGDSSKTLDGRIVSPSVGPGLATSTDATPKSNDPQDSLTEPPKTTNINAASAASSEIDRLRSVFVRNRAEMDPRTAAIIEANLKVIDDAIAQSKAALAQDPASRFLNNQLKTATDKKLELLRTAAQLPSRT